MDTVDIKGRELHFLRMALNWQKYQGCYTLDMLLKPTERQWSEEFIYNCEKKGFIRFEENKIYVTEEAIRPINEKDKRESRLIEEQIIEYGFEYAFLTFMDNRNEPVPLLDMPGNFAYHSEIHMEKIAGSENSYRTWEDQIYKYITDPTIDGYILNHTGKTRLAKLRKDKKLKEDNEALDIQIKQQTVSGTIFSRNVAYLSLLFALLAAFIPLFIWWLDNDKIQETKTEIPQLQQIQQTQQQIQQNLQDVQKTLQSLDTSVIKVKIEK